MGYERRAAAEGGWQYCTRRAVLPVQALLRPALRELARGQERPGLEAGAEDQGRFGGSANMLEPFPESPKGMHHDRYMRLSR